MNSSTGENVGDPETILRAEGERLSANLLRRFACECCRRIANLCPDSIYLKQLQIAEEYAARCSVDPTLPTVDAESDELYKRLYPGYGAPSAAALALSAVGEAAYTRSHLDAAINASSTAAMAVASAAGDAAPYGCYDDVHEAAYRSERQAQLELLRQLDPTHCGP